MNILCNKLNNTDNMKADKKKEIVKFRNLGYTPSHSGTDCPLV